MEDSDVDAGENDPLVGSKGFKNPTSAPPHHTSPVFAKNQNTLSLPRDSSDSTQSKRKKETTKLGSKKQDKKYEASARDGKLLPANAEEGIGREENESTPLCPMFGVRNYLHHFYEKAEEKNPEIYEQSPVSAQPVSEGREAIFLIKRKEGLCSSSIFRLSLMLGGIILLMGTTALIVASCASRRATLVGKIGGVAVVDRVAAAHNAEVDALLLVALIALILGATVVATALISRAFCTKPEYEDAYRESMYGGYASVPDPRFISSWNPKGVPLSEEITRIQPWIGSSHGNLQ